MSEFTTTCRCEACLHYKKLGMQGYSGLMDYHGIPIVDHVTPDDHCREHIYEELDRIRRVQHFKCSSGQVLDRTSRVDRREDCDQKGAELESSATAVDPEGGMLGSPEPVELEGRSFRSRSAPNLLEVDGGLCCGARFRLSLLEEVVI